MTVIPDRMLKLNRLGYITRSSPTCAHIHTHAHKQNILNDNKAFYY